MGVIRRFVWASTVLGVLAILGGTSALAFTGDPQDSGAAERGATQSEAPIPAEQTSTRFSGASVTTPPPSAAGRWMTKHRVPTAR